VFNLNFAFSFNRQLFIVTVFTSCVASRIPFFAVGNSYGKAFKLRSLSKIFFTGSRCLIHLVVSHDISWKVVADRLNGKRFIQVRLCSSFLTSAPFWSPLTSTQSAIARSISATEYAGMS